MSLTLFGSKPSPYVRRIRMLLEGQDYQFELIDLYNDAARAEYEQLTPIKKMPILKVGEQMLYDSHVIAQYIQQKFNLAQPSFNDLNLVSAVDAITDSLIVLFYGKRSGFELDKSKLIFQLQLERIPSVLSWLDQMAQQGAFKEWGYASIALMSLVNWVEFRNLYDLTPYQNLMAAADLHRDRAIVKATMPE